MSSWGDTLQQVVARAIQLNPDVQLAATHKLTTDQQLRQQQAGYLPTLDLSGGAGSQESDNPNSIASANSNSEVLGRTESALSLTQNLFKGFATKYDVSRLKYNVKSAAYKAGSTSEDTALNTVEQYLEMLRHQQFVQLAENNLSVNQGVLKAIRKRTESGVGKRADYEQAKGRVALAQSEVIQQQQALLDTEAAYMHVVGSPPLRLVSPGAPPPSQLPASETQFLHVSLANNPVLKATNADLMAARALHSSSKSKNYPQVDLVLRADRDTNLDGQPGVNNSNLAMVRGTWNLYNGGADLAKQRETAYQIQEAAETRSRVIWQIRSDAAVSWDAWKQSVRALPSLKDHQTYSLETFHAYKEQYEIGQRTLLDVLDAQNEYYQASLNYLTATYTEMFARYRILNITGSLLPYLGVAPPVEARL
jgi:outer membrane protein, adhesin transport system